jgi:drug/metabolite transporter (DMT)-like permease
MTFLATYEILYKKVANSGVKSENIFINTFLFGGIFKVIVTVMISFSTFEFSFINFLIYIPNLCCDLLAAFLYIKSLKRIPISISAPLYLVYYPVSMIFSIVALKEDISFIKIIAIITIGIIIFVLSIKTSSNKLNNDKEVLKTSEHNIKTNKRKHLTYVTKGVIFALVAGIFNALGMSLDKNCLNNGMIPNEMILYNGIGGIIISILLYNRLKLGYKNLIINKDKDKFKDKNEKKLNNNIYKYTLTPMLLLAITIRFLSSISYTTAMSYGNVNTVVPIIASDIILIAILSSVFLKEKIKPYQVISLILFVICIIMLTI